MSVIVVREMVCIPLCMVSHGYFILFITHHIWDLSHSSGCFLEKHKSYICAIGTLKLQSLQICVSINLNLSNNTIKLGQSIDMNANHNYCTDCCEV